VAYCETAVFVLYYEVMARELFDLSGITALVTGGSRGIGLAVAKGLAQQGADIAILARTKKQLEEAKKQIQAGVDKNVWTFAFDLGDTKAIEGLFENVVAETKGIDILVNCAGTTARAPAEEVALDSWNQIIEVNLTAVFAMSQAFCRHRKQAAKGGKIISIGSLLCQAARATNAPYASSKGGLLMLTKSLAVEWAKYKINVNAIGPGYITTELTKPLWTDKEFDRWVLSKTPLERWGQPNDLVGTAVFLASSASDFITGQIIYVDGGWLAML
jgi:gluconate 5-dehydrogenase